MLLFHDQSAAHGDERPVTSLVQSWVAGIMLPAGLLAYVLSSNICLSITAALAIPILAIAQGSIGILKYRLLYGHGPHPITPSHGVVIASGQSSSSNTSSEEQQHRTISIGGCQCSALEHNHVNNNLNRPPRWIAPAVDTTETPLRLLVIGDSLAIGVGQAKQCTPILPETIAKTISRQHNGRTVYWTCHGAPGASTGWIVRELERKQQQDPENESVFFEEETLCCSDTDESISSDESNGTRNKDNDDYGMWRDRILQHRRCFRPGSYLGPYDIVVVITGSNDLKSAFFPFLLTGEDAEFRRQARARGGNYTKELRRLISTLVSCMKGHTFDSTLSPKQRAFQTSSSHSTSFSSTLSETTSLLSKAEGGTRKPLVVFPGLPARALPVFRIAPLRWLSVPIVDILDLHKRRLGNSGEALFVPAPSLDEMAEYENCRGPEWDLRHTDRPRLILRDTPRQDCQRISGRMRDYYTEKDKRVALTGLRRGANENDNPMPANGLFAIDGIHPSDDGYDFWGRYIGDAIVSELKRKDS